MILATKTLAAIEQALEKDQGARYRGLLRETMAKVEDAYNPKEEQFRRHLGASLIGRECARELWYSFHWATSKRHDGRMVRLFNRGHLEEGRFVALLQLIGCEVWQHTQDGKQFRISGHRGHFGGSLDAVVKALPDLPAGVPALAEFKTHGEKSFLKLTANGVLQAKPEHFIQMQCYMGYYSLSYGLYLAVNKNTDELHGEIIQFDATVADRYAARAGMVIDSRTPPPKINTSPGWFACKFCDHRPVCHLKELPAKTCRSCVNSTAHDNGTWLCGIKPSPSILTEEDQLKACFSYTSNPAFKTP